MFERSMRSTWTASSPRSRPTRYINDANREFWGTDAIRKFVAKEIVGDHVMMKVTEVIDHHGQTIVRAAYDGDFDRTNLPDALILTNYFDVRDGRIHNKPSDY